MPTDRQVDDAVAVDAHGQDGITPLILAAEQGLTQAAKQLIRDRAPVDQAAVDGRTALMSAAGNGHLAVVKLLIQAGADVDAVSVRGWTATMVAARAGAAKVVAQLIAVGAAIDARDHDGWSALMSAAVSGNRATVAALLDAGADVAARDVRGRCALGFALENGHRALAKFIRGAGGEGGPAEALVEAILAKKGVRQAIEAGPALGAYDFVHLAIQAGDRETVEALLAAGAELGRRAGPNERTELMAACLKGDPGLVRALVEAGADLESTTRDEPGSMFLDGGETALFFAARRQDIQSIDVLLHAGARLDVVSNGMGTALSEAASNGDLELVQRLIERGADVNLAGGQTPLHSAIEEGHQAVIAYLLGRGADPNLAIWTGSRPLHNAAHRNGCDAIELLLAHGADPALPDKAGATPLMRAVENGHIEAADLLLACGSADLQVLRQLASASGRAAVVALIDGDPVPLGRLVPADQVLFDTASALFKSQDYRGALSQLEQLSEKGRSRVVAVASQLAYCHQQLGDQAQAAAAFERARTLNPSLAHLWRASCFSLCALERWSEMELCAQKAADLSPRDSYAFQQLGIARAQLDRHPEAASALRTALELDPTNGYAAYSLGQSLWASQSPESVAWFAVAFEHAPQLKQAAVDDEDLASLRLQPDFAALLASFERPNESAL